MNSAAPHGGFPSGQSPKRAVILGGVASQSPASSAPPQRKLINFNQLKAKLGTSERTARKVVAEPWMPDPIELGPRALRWVENEVDEALALRAPRREDPGPEPAWLKDGREQKRAASASSGPTQERAK